MSRWHSLSDQEQHLARRREARREHHEQKVVGQQRDVARQGQIEQEQPDHRQMQDRDLAAVPGSH
jgi:hypothetical protein